MHILHHPVEFAQHCNSIRALAQAVTFVPTMGALHRGHAELIGQACARGRCMVSIFVNPTQFNSIQDLQRYPTTLDADRSLCERLGVDAIFTPDAEALYPFPSPGHVSVTGLDSLWEGAHRPGHFQGVTTVLAKLFHLVGPCTAFFGRKDFQQWRVVQRMVDEFFFPVALEAVPCVRDLDGLALSSRNHRLTERNRQQAQAIPRALGAVAQAYTLGERRADELRRTLSSTLEGSGLSVEYAALVDPATLVPAQSQVDQPVALVAATAGSVRLIDNCWLGVDDASGLVTLATGH